MSGDVDRIRQEILDLLEEGEFDKAVVVARGQLDLYPDDPKITMFYGLALAEVGRVDEGTGQLKRATELDPTSAEGFHNVAVALYNQGEYEEASPYAQEALEIDPAHEGAMRVIEDCQAAKGEVSFEADGEKIPANVESTRPGPNDPPIHLLGLGEAWTTVGYVLVFYCVISFCVLIFHPFVGSQGLVRDPGGMISLFLYATSGIAVMFWTLVDIIDRREKFVWLLPMWVCGFAALPVLPLALYLAIGRKMFTVS